MNVGDVVKQNSFSGKGCLGIVLNIKGSSLNQDQFIFLTGSIATVMWDNGKIENFSEKMLEVIIESD